MFRFVGVLFRERLCDILLTAGSSNHLRKLRLSTLRDNDIDGRG